MKFALSFIFLAITLHGFSQDQLFKKINRQNQKSAPLSPAIPARPSKNAAGLGIVAAVPTISAVSPMSGGTGTEISITGTQFDNSSTVSFGNKKAQAVTVHSSTTLTAIVGTGETGDITVTNNNESNEVKKPGFEFIQIPTVKSISPQSYSKGSLVTIIGENFHEPAEVSFNGTKASDVKVISPTVLTAVVEGDVDKVNIVVKTPGGLVHYPDEAESPAEAGADFTLPDLGQGSIYLIPTPTFTFYQVHTLQRLGFNGTVWGNTLNVDSSVQRVVNKLLIPKASLFGLNLEVAYILTDLTNSNCVIGAFAQVNFLVKSVSFYDTGTKNTTNFNPFCIHPKLGFNVSLFKNSVFASLYYNLLTVQSNNKDFAQFFKTSQNAFLYPELDLGGYFNVGKESNQYFKVEFDMILNNKSVQKLYGSGNSLIPYLKFGFVTKI